MKEPAVRPCLSLPFNQIRHYATEAIAAARKVHAEGKLEDAVNWADLRVVSVEYYEDDGGCIGWRVYIEEVSPTASKFQLFIHEYLKAWHLPDVEVRTEW
jgi:hypothetical protein